MERHPGGSENTRKLLQLAEWKPGDRLLDLGAGGGEAVRTFRRLGLEAEGIDQAPKCDDGTVREGDFLHLEEVDNSIDICFSQCAFLVSGNQKRAIREAVRVLKTGGYLLLADLDPEGLAAMTEAAGMKVLYVEDMTDEWRTYYLEALWSDTCCCEAYAGIASRFKGKQMGYTMLAAVKE
ncbi:MAG: class I SAM-dependent methyltransferase [Eubacteriales bacterium]|nr:class I SAM-dependent methyltransferase [Eubacteriales bacterium]